MAREKFDSGDQQQDGAEYTLDAPGLWGGNKGTYKRHVVNADGTSGAELISTPEQADADRYRGIGQGMQGRDAYQLQYGDANAAHTQGAESGQAQNQASNYWQRQATGQDRTAYNYGQGLVQRGVQNQQAAAMSSSGGALAEMSALKRARGGQAAFEQKGTNENMAQQFDSMAAGRSGYAQNLAATRKMDQTGQHLSDQQTEMQAKSEADQRRLNDAGQYGMDRMAFDVHGAALGARQHQQAVGQQEADARDAARDADHTRQMGYLTTGLTVVGGAVGGPGGAMAGQAFGNAGSEATRHNDPDPPSDERAKDKKPNALIRLSRRGAADAKAQGEGMLAGYQAQLNDGPSIDASKPVGAVVAGNIEHMGRSEVDNRDGTTSTVRSMSFNDGPGREVLIPTAYDGAVHSDDEAIANYRKGGQHMGVFRTPEGATAHAEQVHDDYEKGKYKKANDKPSPAATKEKGPLAALAYASGPQHAPKGYAASRSGQVGAIDGGGPKASYDLGFEKKDEQAPGTRDSLKYGTPSVRSERDMDQFSKAVSLSDVHAKRAAFIDGVNHTQKMHDTGDVAPAPEYMNDSKGPGSSAGKPAKPAMGGLVRGKSPGAFQKADPAPQQRRIAAQEAQGHHEDRVDTAGAHTAVSAAGLALTNPVIAPLAALAGTSAGLLSAEEPRQSRPPTQAETAQRAISVSDEDAKNTGEPLGDTVGRKPNPLIEMQKHANRMLAGETYTYKEGVGEDPNQVHHGFMAQNLEKNPITATAVRKDPSGLRRVDNTDVGRVTAAGVASLQEQHDELEDAVAALAGRRKRA